MVSKQEGFTTPTEDNLAEAKKATAVSPTKRAYHNMVIHFTVNFPVRNLQHKL